MVKARSEALGPYKGKVKIGTAVDTRDRLRIEIGDAVGLYAGGVIYEFNYRQDRPFWENVREYHKVVKKHLKDNNIFGPIYDQIALDPTLLDAMLFAMIGGQVEPHQSRYKKLSEFARCQKGLVAEYLDKFAGNIPDVMTTNLGRLDLPEEVDGIKVEGAFFTPSTGLKLEIVLGVATAGGRLTASLNYYERTSMVRRSGKSVTKLRRYSRPYSHENIRILNLLLESTACSRESSRYWRECIFVKSNN